MIYILFVILKHSTGSPHCSFTSSNYFLIKVQKHCYISKLEVWVQSSVYYVAQIYFKIPIVKTQMCYEMESQDYWADIEYLTVFKI
jgi:hypothetical protein